MFISPPQILYSHSCRDVRRWTADVRDELAIKHELSYWPPRGLHLQGNEAFDDPHRASKSNPLLRFIITYKKKRIQSY